MAKHKLSFREADEEKPMAPKDGVKADHADEDQDKALFAKMIKQYLGKDGADEEEMEMAKQAYQAHKEAGMKHDEAFEAAGKHLKMAMEIGKKMHQAMEKKENEGEGEVEKHEGEKHEDESEAEKHEAEKHEDEAEGECKEKQVSPDKLHAGKKEKKHESASSVAQLAGEVAKLRESLKHYELRDHLETKLKKSGESNQCTKLFREALGKPRSLQHIDETWNTFIKAYKAGADEVGSDDAVFTEKNSYRGESEGKKSLSDCLR